MKLTRDALTKVIDCAIVLSNDTDLVEPMKIARAAGIRIGLLSPILRKQKPSGGWFGAHSSLVGAADFTIHMHNKHLRNAQFPNPIKLPDGTDFYKPVSWV